MAFANRDGVVGGMQGVTKSFMILGMVQPTFKGALGSKIQYFFTQIEEVADLNG